uniref:DUF2235 domain-containing protein n=1 Tax=Heterorhabditis bacteriophora TaxID=37862 RepID=A0A1I7WZE2_HETBA
MSVNSQDDEPLDGSVKYRPVIKTIGPRYRLLRDNLFPYDSNFIRHLLHDVHILFIGDSLTRAIYKDLVGLLQNDDLLSDINLKGKTEYVRFDSAYMLGRPYDECSEQQIESERIGLEEFLERYTTSAVLWT